MFLIGFLAAIFSILAPATQPLAPNGDLPEGAITLLGSRRFTSGYRFRTVAFSPDGKKLVTTHDAGPAIVWSFPEGKRLLQLEDATDAARTSDFFTRQFAQQFARHINRADSAVFLGPDKILIVWGSRTLAVRDATSGKVIASRDFDDAIAQIVGSPDGSRFVVVRRSGPMQLWDADKFVPICELGEKPRNDSTLNSLTVSFGDGGKTLMTFGRDRPIQFWDAATGAQRKTPSVPADVSFATISPDGKTILTLTTGLRLFDAQTGDERLPQPRLKLGIHNGLVSTPRSAVYSLDSSRVALIGQTIYLFDVAQNKLMSMINQSSRSLCFSPDGKTLVSARITTSADVYDVSDLSKPKQLTPAGFDFIPTGIEAMQINRDGSELFTGDFVGNLARWDIATGKLLASAASSGGDDPIAQILPIETARTLIVTWNGKRRFIDPKTLEEIQTEPDQTNHRRLRAIGTNADIVVEQDHDDDDVRVWNRSTKADICTIPGNGQAIGGLAISPDQKQLVVGMRDVLRVFALPQGKQIFQVETPQKPCDVVLFSPDGKVLFASFGGLHALSAEDGQQIWASNRWAQAMSISDDGALIACCGEEETTASILDASTGEVITQLSGGHEGGITQLQFLPDQHRVISGGMDTTAIVWDYRAVLLNGAKDKPIEDLWSDLGSADAKVAWQAAALLANHPRETLDTFAAHVHPGESSKYVELIRQLGADDPKVREQAHHELERAGAAAIPAVRAALAHPPEGEAGERLKAIARLLQIDDVHGTADQSGDARILPRAKMVLRWIDTPESQKLLQQIQPGK